MWEELGIGVGTGFFIISVLYLTVKCAVKNGIREVFDERDKRLNIEQEKNSNEVNNFPKESETKDI